MEVKIERLKETDKFTDKIKEKYGFKYGYLGSDDKNIYFGNWFDTPTISLVNTMGEDEGSYYEIQATDNYNEEDYKEIVKLIKKLIRYGYMVNVSEE